jgi:hypothetical protein
MDPQKSGAIVDEALFGTSSTSPTTTTTAVPSLHVA